MPRPIDDHKQDLVILGVVCVVLTVFTVVAMMQSGPTDAGGDAERAPAVVVAVRGPAAGGGGGSGGGSSGGAGAGQGASDPSHGAGEASEGGDPEPGTWQPSGDLPELGDVGPETEVVEVELDQIDLAEFDIVLPGGLVLPRAATSLVERQPRGLRGLAVYDASGTLYYASVDGAWTTLWAESEGKRRTVWCGETGATHFEIAGLSGDEILLVKTDEEPFESRRKAWARSDGFHSLRISKPGIGAHKIRLSKSLISAVLAYCD